MNFLRSFVVLVACGAAVVAIPAAQASCTNASINGVYGILSTGLNGSLQPAASVDRVVVDGAGNATGTSTKSIDGTIVTYNFTGAYQLATNCTGTATWTNQIGNTEHDNLALNNANKGAFLIQTDANHVHSGLAVALGSTIVCTDAAVKRRYSMELTGTDIGVGQVAMGGQLSLNGTGLISGVATLSQNGTITSAVKVTGTYSINSDCTGTAQITPQGLSAMNFALLVVNLDKEIMAVETDTNTIVAGTMQQ